VAGFEAARQAVRGLDFKIPLPLSGWPLFQFRSEV